MASSETFSIVREIGIDAAHRVPMHGSKCRALHGHRYTIEAHCEGPLAEAGEQQGMVLDFGFLKEEMMKEIDEWCDHATILQDTDPLIKLLAPDYRHVLLPVDPVYNGAYRYDPENSFPVKLYIINCAPTAENLARHWFLKLARRVEVRSNNLAKLVRVVVHETPNCRAAYPA